MKQKLIAIDLDGTTLNNDSALTPKTITVLQQVEQLGHKVVIVTGRPYRNSKEIYQQLNMHGPLVNFNGALCHIPGDDSWDGAYNVTLSKDIVSGIVELFPKTTANMMTIEGKNCLYATQLEFPPSPYFSPKTPPILFESVEKLEEQTTAITLFAETEKQDFIKEKLLSNYPGAIDVRTWGGILPCLEVVCTGVHKAKGVSHVAGIYGINREDILAFGDEDNDKEMIEYAGHGVAMNNAIPELKAIANDITEFTNHDDGLAIYLQNYFQLNKM